MSAEKPKVTYVAYNPVLQFMRSDKSVRVIVDTSKDQWAEVSRIPDLPNGTYKVTMELLDEAPADLDSSENEGNEDEE